MGRLRRAITSVQIAYRFPYSGGRVRVTQPLPLALGQTTVILRKLDGVEFQLANGQGQRDVPLEGRMYVVLNGGALPVGTPLDLTLSGLAASFRSGRCIWGSGWARSSSSAAACSRSAAPPRAGREEDARALKVRRATLFEQLVSLERRRTGKLRDDPGLNARRNELMSQIEALDDALAEAGDRRRARPLGEATGVAVIERAMTVEPRSESLNAGSAAR